MAEESEVEEREAGDSEEQESSASESMDYGEEAQVAKGKGRRRAMEVFDLVSQPGPPEVGAKELAEKQRRWRQ